MPTDWQYDRALYNPSDFAGFVYLVEHLPTGKKYIGKKFTYRTSKRKIVGPSNWPQYWGSSKSLLADIKLLGKENFRRTILVWCKTRPETNYAEVELQFKYDVLKSRLPDGSREYYNNTIMGKFFGVPEDVGPAIQAAHARRRAEKRSSLGLPACESEFLKLVLDHARQGYSKRQIAIKFECSPNSIKELLADHDVVPVHSSKSRREYSENTRHCSQCQIELPFERKRMATCSDECAYQAKVKHCLATAQQDGFRARNSKKSSVTRKEATAKRLGFESRAALDAKIQSLLDDGKSRGEIAELTGATMGIVKAHQRKPK